MYRSNSTRNPFHWLELGSSTPSGLFLEAGHTPARHVIFRHRTGYRFTPVAVQLDETPDRPAFSFRFLLEDTGITGVYFGETRVTYHLERFRSVRPRRCGEIGRPDGENMAIKCTTPDAAPQWLSMDDLPHSAIATIEGEKQGCEYRFDAVSSDKCVMSFFELVNGVEYFLAGYDSGATPASRFELDISPNNFAALKR